MKHLLILSLLLMSLQMNAQTLQNNSNTYESTSVSSYDAYNPFAELLYYVVESITYGILFETYWEKDTPMHDAQITPYPYFSPKDGNYNYDGEFVPFRLEAETNILTDFKGHLTGDFQAKLRFLKRLDVAASYSNLHQFLSGSYASQTYFLLQYHRIRTKGLDVWYGGGAMIANDEARPAVSLGGELFLGNNTAFSAKAKWGFFNENITRDVRYQFNYFVSRWRLSAGLRGINLPEQHTNTFFVGARYYF